MASILTALYEKTFSEEARLTHAIGAAILWDGVKSLLAPKPHPVLDGIEIMGVCDDDSFFHYQRENLTRRFLHYWRTTHNELPFREDLETFLRNLKLSKFESALRCEIHFFFKEGVDEVDRTHHEATYYWVRDQQPSLMAFPVYEHTKIDETGGICFTQKIIYATLSKDDPEVNEKPVTNVIKRIAGPRGNFYQDVSAIQRPRVNLALTFWNERSEGFRYLKLTDTWGQTCCYDLESYTEAQWPTDALEHLATR